MLFNNAELILFGFYLIKTKIKRNTIKTLKKPVLLCYNEVYASNCNKGEMDMNLQGNLFTKKMDDTRIKEEITCAPVLKSIIDSSPIATNLWTQDMVLLMCNKHMLSIFDVGSEQEYIDNFYKFSPKVQPNGVSSAEMSKTSFDKALENGIYIFNCMHILSNKELVPCEITLVRIDGYDDKKYVIGFIRDLRPEFARVSNENYDYFFTDMIPTNILLNKISELTTEWFFSIDLRTGTMQQFNKSTKVKDGQISELFSFEEVIQSGLVHKDDIEDYKNVVGNLKQGVYKPYDIRFINENNEYRYLRLVYQTVNDNNDKPVFVIGKGVDVHEQKILKERSQKDLLTNCYNKISSEQIVAEKLKNAPNGMHALFMIDIDNFKGINDNLGHFFGDEVLKEIADNLRSVFRDEDIIARVGGDEFSVFLENITSEDVLRKKAQTILDVYKKTYSGEYKNYSISGSVGISVYPRSGKSYEDLYQSADKALYQAKALGKNRYVFYSNVLQGGTMRNTTKIENAERLAGTYFDYDLIAAVFNILYERNGDNLSINFALKYICQKYGADRSYIFETLDDGDTFSNTFEFCNDGISSEINNLQDIPVDIFIDFVEKAHNGIIYSNNLRETLELDKAFETMANQGILSFVHAQIKKDDKMTFFIGLDDCTKTRVWTEREINSLQYIGKLLSIILQSTRLRKEVDILAENNKNSTHILDSTDDVVYISDTQTYELLYLNKAAINIVGNPTEEVWRSKKCYEILQGLPAPCDFCTNHLLAEDEFYEWSYYNPVIDGTFLLKDKLIPFNGRLARLEIATNISKITTLERELQEKLEDERFLADCVEMLHSGKEPTVSIYDLLKSVANYYKSARSYIFEVSSCGKFVSNTYEWCAEGEISYKSSLQNFDAKEFEYFFERCKTQASFSLTQKELSSNKQNTEYKLMVQQNVERLIISPIISQNKEISGFVGIDDPTINIEKTFIMQSVAKFIANFIDETEFITKLNKLSYYDNLTGAKNRHSYSDCIKQVNKKHIDSLGVIYIDIKGLGGINDSKGILFGDTVLKRLAVMLSNIFGDDVYRVGGDEFVVIKANMQESVFEKNIALLRRNLQSENDFDATIGYTWNQNYDDVVDKSTADGVGGKYKRILSNNLDMEILNDKYVVFLQPQVDLASNKVFSAEALIRRKGAQGALQPPISFIPFYEKEGIISKIDVFVFEEICKALKMWKDLGHTHITSVAVNCSRMTIAEKGIVGKFVNICDKYGVDKSKIVIEITETTNEISESVLSSIIQNFNDAGFSVSLDDFGSGYSNLTSFVTSDFDEVKIDMKLVNEIHKNETSRALTEVVLVLCNKLNGLVSVAEGVECKEQCEILKKMGCTKGQGYYFDKPMPIEEFSIKYVLNQ